MNEKIEIISREIEFEEKQILFDKYKTALDKARFLNKIKGELGEEIKKNPNKVKIIEKTWSEKFFIRLKKIFTKF